MYPPQTSQSDIIQVTGFTVARRHRFRILKLLTIPFAINRDIISNTNAYTHKQTVILELYPPSTSLTSMI